MNYSATKLSGACLVEPLCFPDSRGSFSRLWCEQEFDGNGFPFKPKQMNFVRTIHRGTIRGMHYQKPPQQIAKLIICTRGSLYDVMLDIRPDSPTFLQWQGIMLSESEPRMLMVPAGFAHGYQTLEQNTDALYLMDGSHDPSAETGIRWNDSRFNFVWKSTPEKIISQRDQEWADFQMPS